MAYPSYTCSRTPALTLTHPSACAHTRALWVVATSDGSRGKRRCERELGVA